MAYADLARRQGPRKPTEGWPPRAPSPPAPPLQSASPSSSCASFWGRRPDDAPPRHQKSSRTFRAKRKAPKPRPFSPGLQALRQLEIRPGPGPPPSPARAATGLAAASAKSAIAIASSLRACVVRGMCCTSLRGARPGLRPRRPGPPKRWAHGRKAAARRHRADPGTEVGTDPEPLGRGVPSLAPGVPCLPCEPWLITAPRSEGALMAPYGPANRGLMALGQSARNWREARDGLSD